MSWPEGRNPTVGPLTLAGLGAPTPAATSTPVPDGRGRWRLLLHRRNFVPTHWNQSVITELADARSRRLEQKWNSSATLTFTLDGHSPAAALIAELQTDVTAWRWDEATGRDWEVFRGVVAQSEDEISEQTHTVTFTCHDYVASLQRRLLAQPLSVTQVDQDALVAQLVAAAVGPTAGSGAGFNPGGFLPIASVRVGPDSTARTLSTQLRDRTYTAGSVVGDLLDNLALVIGGFDYDLIPFQQAADIGISGIQGNPTFLDVIRVFYPYQGVQRFEPLEYGSSVATVTRAVNSGDYANYWRVIGNNGSDDPAAPQLFGEYWNADNNDVTRIPIGLWQSVDNAADVSIQSTLDQQAQGNVALSGLVVPTYTIGLRPGAYTWRNPNMGDVVPLVVRSGRLNETPNVRVVGITYAIGDDGDEDVSLTVGRPGRTLTQLFTQTDRDVDALTRR